MLFGTQKIGPGGRLEVGGVDACELAERYGTPLYVLDEEALRARCREYVEAFRRAAPGATVAYAAKAFLSKAMARLAHEEGLHLDVASFGELRVALAAGFPPERITFHGNFKKDEEVRAALGAGVGLFVADSFEELRAVSAAARSLGKKQRALVRVAPGIDPHTFEAVSTGGFDTKFGFTAANGAALRAVEECLAAEGIELAGLHAHIGSQILSLDPYRLLVEKLLELAEEIGRKTGWTPGFLGLGGGLGIRYSEADVPPAPEDLARTVAEALRRGARDRNLPEPKIGVEPGRSIVGEAGLTLYRVGPVKEVPSEDGGTRVYATVDGGLSDNPRPLMYGATYPAVLANRASETPARLIRVAGRHCETDTLFDVPLPLPRPGDILAVQCTGAYNHSMASNYNCFFRPPVVFVRGGSSRAVVRRETEEDLLARDVG